MQNYKKLRVWKMSHELCLDIYKATAKFPREEIFGVTSQMRRASSSIPANISEGCGKFTRPDLARFLNIALGSANELDYFLTLSKDLNYIPFSVFVDLDIKINKIKSMLIRLIEKVRKPQT